MKGLNKIALATAVAAAPFATQAMEPMTDAAMGNTTGQAGVTIELNTEMSIGQIEYSQGSNTGSVLVNNVEVGGMGTAPSLGYGDGLDMEINVDLAAQGDKLKEQYDSKAGSALGGENLTLNEGDALISVQNYNSPATVTGPSGGTTTKPVPVDMRVELGANGGDDAFQLSGGGNQATLISNLKMDVFLSQLDIIARNSAATDASGNPLTNGVGNDTNGAIEIEAGFAIDDLDADFDVASVGIQDMQLTGNQAFEAGVIGSNGSSSQGDGSVLDAGAAIVSMDIGQGVALSGSSTAGGETLRVDLANFKADIWMPTINVGGATNASIGSVAIDNLNVKNTQMAIYGRD